MTDESDAWETPPRDLGPCCVCGKAQDGTVRNLLMLPFEGPRGHAGWGCVVCGLDPIGATAIICDACTQAHPEHLEEQIQWVMAGRYASEGERVLLKHLDRRPHEHHPERHRGEEA